MPQACITARKTTKTGWRGPCPYKPTKPIRLTCPLRAADLTGSEPPMRQPVFKVWGDSLFSWFSFVSAPRFDAGESAIGGVEGGERRASHKPSAPTMAEGLSPWRWHKGVFLVLVLKTKMNWICRVRRYFLVHHIEHPIKFMNHELSCRIPAGFAGPRWSSQIGAHSSWRAPHAVAGRWRGFR